MAKDVAQREIDLAGFKISNLGDPKESGDATKTDNQRIPLAGRRDGDAGHSVLASPADHIHPLDPDLFTLSDPTPQVVTAQTEIWLGVVDFDLLNGDRVQVGLAGMLQGCVVSAWLDGEVGNPTAGTLVMNIDSSSPNLVPIAAVGSSAFPRPEGAHLLTLTAEPTEPGVPGQTVGRTVTLRGLF